MLVLVDHPQECACIEEQLHGRRLLRREPSAGSRSATRVPAVSSGNTGPLSNASSSSSDHGSKNDGGMVVVPFANPIGRGSVRFFGTARSSATGWFRLQMITVSPAATASRYSDSFAFAS